MRGHAGALRSDGILRHLHDNGLAGGDDILDIPAFRLRIRFGIRIVENDITRV